MSKAFLPTILEQKEKEVAQMVMEDLQPLRQTYRLYDFLKSHQEHLQIIAEVKKASPSMGDINLDVDIVTQAKTYEENGAAMISVLTDQVFFKGDLDYLRKISSQVTIPTFAKDFILSLIHICSFWIAVQKGLFSAHSGFFCILLSRYRHVFTTRHREGTSQNGRETR